MIYTVKNTRFTHGSMFGEQYWTLEDENGKTETFAMWEDLKSPNWARVGEKIQIERINDTTCSLGGGSTIKLSNCAKIVCKITP